MVDGKVGPTINATEDEKEIEEDKKSPEDRPSSEQVMRPVFVYGMTGVMGNGQEVIQGEKVIRWSYSESGAMNVCAYNPTASAVGVSKTVIFLLKHYGVCLRD